MRWLSQLKHIARDLAGRDRFEREMNEEIESYLALRTEDHARRGLTREEAVREARQSLGGVEQARERLRAERFGVFAETLWRDVGYALRRMRRQMGFTSIAVLTLALGIGANTAILSVVKSVLMAPLPFHDSDRMFRLRLSSVDSSGHRREGSLVPAYFHALRDRSRLLERLAVQRFQNLTLTDNGEPERVVGIGVSDQWLETLGVEPLIGRPFSAQEQKEGSASRVVLISHGFWQRRFAADPGILGRAITLDDQVYSIIGVMPRQFRYPYNADLWLPMTFDPTALSPGDLNTPARMRAGVTSDQLGGELDEIAAALRKEFAGVEGVGIFAVPMREEFQRDPERSIGILVVAVGFVLLLACVNLATLLLARGDSRRREMAVRTALGAGRWRQIRQLLTESLVLSFAGGVAGVAVAFFACQWLTVLIPQRLSEVIQDVRVDGAVLAASAAICLATGLLFGLAPALRLTRRGPAEALKDGARSAGSKGRGLGWLVVGEVAMATVLLFGAGVMAQNVAKLLGSDVGYDPAGLTRVNISLPESAYATAGRRAVTITRIVENVEALPGVQSAGVTMLQPIPRTRTNIGTLLTLESAADSTARPPAVNRRLVTPGYFRAMGLRLLGGRWFGEADNETGAPVAIVNEAAARRFWPGEDPVGRRVRRGNDASAPWLTVVGVVSNMAEPSDEMRETLFEPYSQSNATLPPGSWFTTSVSLMVRHREEMPGIVDQVRRAVWTVDPKLPLYDLASMESALVEPLHDQRLGALVVIGFGGFGLFMAVLGTYGVLAFSVSARFAEFGVRLALGASPGQLLRTVMGQGLRLVAGGLVLGLLAAMAASRLLDAVISEVSPRDPWTAGAVAAVLLVAGIAACWVPARRATRVDPLTALRAE